MPKDEPITFEAPRGTSGVLDHSPRVAIPRPFGSACAFEYQSIPFYTTTDAYPAMVNKPNVPGASSPGALQPATTATLSTAEADEMNDLVKRVTACLSINETYPDVEATKKDRCVRDEVLGMVRDGLDDLSVLARRIEAALSPATLSGEVTSKKEVLQLSKEDEWFLVQEHLVAEERERQRRCSEQKKKEQAAKQREHQEFLLQAKVKKEEQKREKARELEAMKKNRSELEAHARHERAARRQEGEAVRANRQAQVTRAKETQALVSKLRKVVDEREKQAVMDSLREEQERLARERRLAQDEMQRLLAENQKTLELKQLEAQKEKAETVKCMEEYAKMLLHQEQQRHRQLERIHEIQRAQERAPDTDLVAAGTKTWIDDAVVDKQAWQNEQAAFEREKQAQLAAQRRNNEVVKALDEQVKGKQSNRNAQLMTKAADKQRLIQMGEEAKENHRTARRQAVDKRLALKRGLDVQIVQQRNSIRAGLGMNRLERALNAQVLQKARGG